MPNIGLTELLVIAAVVLIIFGPKRLPEFAKSLGKGIRDFKKALEGGQEEENAQKEKEQLAQKGETHVVKTDEEKVPVHGPDKKS